MSRKVNPYKPELIKKVVSNLQEKMRLFMASEKELKIHISTGNKKIGRVHNFSMAPIITCSNCGGCKNYCYDIKAVLQYTNVLTARAENTAAMMKDRERTFQGIDYYIGRRHLHKAFRWHVSGDILDVDYFDHMVEIARRHPDWIFWTYTKNYTAVNKWIVYHGGTREAIPSNLSVMFSVWNGMPCLNPFNMPTFTCIMDGVEPDPEAWNCPGNCEACIASGHGCPHGEKSQVGIH